MARSVRARSGWRKISPGCRERPLGRKTRSRSRPLLPGTSRCWRASRRAVRPSGIRRPVRWRAAIASANDFVPYSRSATSPASTIPGTSALRMPATGTHSFSPWLPAGPRSRPAAACDCGRNRRWPVSAWCPRRRWQCTLPSLVRIRIGASPPIPKCENSVTDAANIAAMPASTALPPREYMRMPASVAYSVPAAIAPRRPREGSRTVGSAGRALRPSRHDQHQTRTPD